jgi:tRNA G18 (ribose-2'-O)-methylase SpoU
VGIVRRITEPGGAALADYVRLTDMQLRMSTEVAAGLFVAEGELVVLRALAAGYEPRSVLLSTSRWRLLGAGLRAEIEARPGLRVLVGDDELLREVTGFHVHRGVLASFHRRPLPDAATLLAASERVLVLESVNTHTNVGAIARSAAALGMDALLLDPTSADPLYRRSVRVSMGQVLVLPHARLDPWPAALGQVRGHGYRLALSPTGERSLDTVVPQPGQRVAVLLGAEGTGLSEAAQAEADERVRIPMGGGVDSLNVAVAAALACWVIGRRDPTSRPPGTSA